MWRPPACSPLGAAVILMAFPASGGICGLGPWGRGSWSGHLGALGSGGGLLGVMCPWGQAPDMGPLVWEAHQEHQASPPLSVPGPTAFPGSAESSVIPYKGGL